MNPTQKLKSPTWQDYALLTLIAAVWGSSFMLIKIAVETIPAVSLTAMRLIIAAIVLYAFALFSGQNLPRGAKVWGLMALVAIFGNALPFTLISWGQERVDSGLAAIMMAVMPLSTLLLAHIFTTDEKLNRWKFAGVLLGMVGLVVLIGPGKLSNFGGDVVRQLAIALAAFCYGISALIVKVIKGVPALAMTAGIMLVSALIMVPAALIANDVTQIAPSTSSLSAGISLGLLQTALASLLAFIVIQKLGATFFSQLNFMVPLFGVMLGATFLGETLGLNAFAALAIILVGVGLARHGIKKAAEQN